LGVLLQATAISTTKRAKGTTLEDLAQYLFSLLPGCIPERNVRDTALAYESDIVVRNLYKENNSIVDMFGRYFLVECKNWDKRIDVEAVGYFLFRMRMLHSKFGVIFSRKGITGSKSDEASRALIRRNYHEDGSICVVLDANDLNQLSKERTGFHWMLLHKMEEFRFGRPQ
jgi:hypothetical protein